MRWNQILIPQLRRVTQGIPTKILYTLPYTIECMDLTTEQINALSGNLVNATLVIEALEADSINRYVTHLQENTRIPYPALWSTLDQLVDLGIVSMGNRGGPTEVYL